MDMEEGLTEKDQIRMRWEMREQREGWAEEKYVMMREIKKW